MTIIGVEFLTVTVSEEVTSGAVEVCVVIFSPRLACPIIFPFEINFYTEPISAGEASNALF